MAVSYKQSPFWNVSLSTCIYVISYKLCALFYLVCLDVATLSAASADLLSCRLRYPYYCIFHFTHDKQNADDDDDDDDVKETGNEMQWKRSGMGRGTLKYCALHLYILLKNLTSVARGIFRY